MSFYKDFIRNLNEEEVKKPYGEKPEEGKAEKIGKKAVNKITTKKENKVYSDDKLKNVNKQSEDVYPNDTAKVADTEYNDEHTDEGDIAKKNTKKASTKVRFPFGDKPGKSDSKLIKE